jgi:hypothetical protein
MNSEIAKKISNMESISLFLNATLKNCKFGKTKKQSIFLAYYDMNLEYITSIHLLIKNKIYGVPSAIVRLHLETLYKALWVNYCAENKEIDKINVGTFKFPGINKLVTDIDKIFESNNIYQNIKDNRWKEMCEYTHTGTQQLAKRYKNGELKPNYSQEIIVGILEGTEFILQDFVMHLLDSHDCYNELKLTLEFFSKNNQIFESN